MQSLERLNDILRDQDILRLSRLLLSLGRCRAFGRFRKALWSRSKSNVRIFFRIPNAEAVTKVCGLPVSQLESSVELNGFPRCPVLVEPLQEICISFLGKPFALPAVYFPERVSTPLLRYLRCSFLLIEFSLGDFCFCFGVVLIC